MKEIIKGWVLIVDMYYYRKRLMKRYYNIKYYERHRVLKVDSIGFFENLSDSFTSLYNFCFKNYNLTPISNSIKKSFNDLETKKLNDAIKKECERNDNRRLFIEARVKNKIDRFEDWKLYGYRVGVFNQDEVRMLLDDSDISKNVNVPEIGVDKHLLDELQYSMK